MYSKAEENQIRNMERDSFILLKEQENKDRSIPFSDDILYISDFTLEKYSNSGDSGDLYLATNKHNPKEKYILKHEYYDCACNEYMYSKIGNKMGVEIAPVKLFILDNKRNKFKSDFVCGIKYLENSEHVNFKYVEENKNNIDNWKDYIKMLCLEMMFDEGDGIEVVKYGTKIYRIDTTDAFTLSDFFIHPLAYDFESNGINLRESAKNIILQSASIDTDTRIRNWGVNTKFFCEKIGEKYLDDYLETFNMLEKVTDDDIEEWTNILTFIYPNVIGEYFINYFKKLKSDAKKFIIMMREKQLVSV